MKTISYILIGVAGLALFVWALNTGMKKTDIMNCQKWQRMAEEYPKFFITGDQADQCNYYGIKINADIIQ